MILRRRRDGIRCNPRILLPLETDRIVDPQLLVELVGIALALISYDTFRDHFALLITQGHEHAFPVLEILIHSFLDSQIDRRSNLAEKEVTKYPLFRVNP